MALQFSVSRRLNLRVLLSYNGEHRNQFEDLEIVQDIRKDCLFEQLYIFGRTKVWACSDLVQNCIAVPLLSIKIEVENPTLKYPSASIIGDSVQMYLAHRKEILSIMSIQVILWIEENYQDIYIMDSDP